jgi:hypothetical protein
MLDADVIRDLEKSGAEGMADWSNVFSGTALNTWEDAMNAILNEDLETAQEALEDLQGLVNPRDAEAYSVARGALTWFERMMDNY